MCLYLLIVQTASISIHLMMIIIIVLWIMVNIGGAMLNRIRIAFRYICTYMQNVMYMFDMFLDSCLRLLS